MEIVWEVVEHRVLYMVLVGEWGCCDIFTDPVPMKAPKSCRVAILDSPEEICEPSERVSGSE